jgi:ribonuclease HI
MEKTPKIEEVTADYDCEHVELRQRKGRLPDREVKRLREVRERARKQIEDASQFRRSVRLREKKERESVVCSAEVSAEQSEILRQLKEWRSSGQYEVVEMDDASSGYDEVGKDGVRLFEKRAVVYADGACEGNGKTDGSSVAGIGVFFGVGCVFNLSEMVVPQGRPVTNSIGELFAAIRAVETVERFGYSRVEVGTDCALVVDYFRSIRLARLSDFETGRKMKWRTNDGLYLILEQNCARFREVVFVKVRGHGIDLGNVRADSLARQAVCAAKQNQ